MVKRVSAETKRSIGIVLDLTRAGNSPKEVAAEIGKSIAFVKGLLVRLPKLIAAMEAEAG